MIQIFVRHINGRLYTVDVDLDTTLNQVLYKLGKKVSIPTALLYFVIYSKYIKYKEFERTISDLNIKKEQTLDLRLQVIRGGNIFIYRTKRQNEKLEFLSYESDKALSLFVLVKNGYPVGTLYDALIYSFKYEFKNDATLAYLLTSMFMFNGKEIDMHTPLTEYNINTSSTPMDHSVIYCVN